MYSLDCEYYTKEFNTIEELVENAMECGMDLSYEITKDGEGIGEELIHYVEF